MAVLLETDSLWPIGEVVGPCTSPAFTWTPVHPAPTFDLAQQLVEESKQIGAAEEARATPQRSGSSVPLAPKTRGKLSSRQSASWQGSNPSQAVPCHLLLGIQPIPTLFYTGLLLTTVKRSFRIRNGFSSHL